MNIRNLKSAATRREALEKELGVKLPHIGSFTLDETIAGSRNCENMIGITQVPVGVAGPVQIKNLKLKNKNYYIPLATTEGALVASINRGCKAISFSGGAETMSVRIGATRGPVFRVLNLSEEQKLYKFMVAQRNEFNRIAKTTSGHITLTDVKATGVGRQVYVRFCFDTQDAMGLNMVTIATQKIVEFITEKTGVKCISLAGNYDVDKKPSWLNVTHGRGFEVWSEVVLSKKVLSDVLHATAVHTYETWLSKCMIGSAVSGSMGFNAQYANVLAALFIAIGQDPAHISECSVGITTAEVIKGEDLYMSVYLPDLMVGIVGGGTGLATQKEALSIVGAKTSQEFAEIVGAAVLAGEISLLASLSEGTLARAHTQLARGGI